MVQRHGTAAWYAHMVLRVFFINQTQNLGFTSADDTWEPLQNLYSDLPHAVTKFLRSLGTSAAATALATLSPS